MILVSQEQIAAYTQAGFWGEKTLVDIFKENVSRSTGKVALVDPVNRDKLVGTAPRRLTYAEVDRVVDRLALGLLELGVKPDDVVMVQLPNIVELAMCYLACARIGAVTSPVPVQYRSHELNYALSLTEATAFITVDQFAGFRHAQMVQGIQKVHPSLKSLIVVGTEAPAGAVSFAAMEEEPREEKYPAGYLEQFRRSANDVFTLAWTSGTEADPKGVPRSHNHWIAISSMLAEMAALTDRDVIHCPFPMINMSGLGVLYVPWILCGGTLVMHHPFDVAVYLRQIAQERVTFTGGPPAILIGLLNQPQVLAQADFSSVRVLGCGSAPVPPFVITQFRERFGVEIINIFGSNEGTALVSSPQEVPDPVERGSLFPRWGVPGFAWALRGTRAISTKLVDPATGEEVTEIGGVGELYYKSPSIFSGYYKRPDLTAKAFDPEGYFKSGDLFAIATNDRYRFTGRAKDLIIRGGMNISPEEIESLLQDHPKVLELAAVGMPDWRMGEKTCVYVAPKPGESVTLEELVAFLKAKDVAVYKLPERLEIIGQIPRNPLGKILKNELREDIKRKLEVEAGA